MSENVTPYNAPLSHPAPAPATSRLNILKRIGVLKAGIVLSIVYAFLGLIFALLYAPIMLFGASVGGEAAMLMGGMGLGMIIVIPIVYAIFGFIGGILAAAIYNLVANWTGGLEFTFQDADSMY